MKEKFIIAILLVIALSGVIYAYQSNGKAYLKKSDTFRLAAPQTRLDTSNWQNYEGEEISFKYPTDWKVEVNNSQESVTNFYLMDASKEYISEGSPVVPIILSHGPNKNPTITIEDYTERIGGSVTQTLDIDGEVGYRTVNTWGVPYAVVVFYNDKMLSASSNSSILNEDQQKIDDIFETVLSTIKFKN